MSNLAFALLLGGYLLTRCAVIPGHDGKYLYWITPIHIVLTEMNAAEYDYFNKSV